jgi:protease IV
VVREGRGKRLKENEDTFSGLFWNGEQAVQLGLADHLGSLDKIARDVIKAEDVIDYTVKENLAERLAKRFGASIGAGAVQAMRSAVTLR